MTDLDEILTAVVSAAKNNEVKTAASIGVGVGAGVGAVLGLRKDQPIKNAVIGAGLGAVIGSGLAWMTGEMSKGSSVNSPNDINVDRDSKTETDLTEELAKNV